MFSHIKSLTKMGVGEVHTGTSMKRAGEAPAFSGPSRSAASSKKFGSALPPRAERAKAAASKKAAFGAGGPKIKQMVQGRSRSVKSTPAGGGKASCSFEKRKGVVNGLGGAKDVTRKPSGDAVGVRKGSGNINGFAGPVEARAPVKRLMSKKQAAAVAVGTGPAAAPAPAPAPARRAGVGGTVGGGAGSKAKPPAARAAPRARTGAGAKAAPAARAGAKAGAKAAPAAKAGSSSAGDVRAARAAFLARFE